MSGTLVLVRHGQSDWNLKNLFTGWRDPDLTELGIEEAKAAARRLPITASSSHRNSPPSSSGPAYLPARLDAVGPVSLETVRDQALNERDYGDLSGLNKDDARRNGAKNRSISGAAPTTCRRPAARACATGARLALLPDPTSAARAFGREGARLAHGNSLRLSSWCWTS